MHSNDISHAAPAPGTHEPSRADQIDRLLEEIAPGAPCGANLEYEPEFLQLQAQATPRAEQQYGDTVIPAEAPDWRAIERLALALSARTKDLRVAAYLTRSWTELHGIAGYADGLALVAGMIERWWDDVHPRIDAEGDTDPTPRINALAEVAGAHDCARAARRQPLFEGGPGLRDAERMLDGRDDGAQAAGGREPLLASLAAALQRGERPLAPALAVLRALDAIRACVTQRLGGESAPDASDTEKALRRIVEAMPRETPAQAADAVAPAATSSGDRAWRDADMMSRDDVRIGIDRMCRYFELHEPGHPAPILLRRAQRLLALDFYEIIRDLAPESLPKLDMLSGEVSGERNE